MAGASREHNLIALNLGGELRANLRDRPCETYVSDMRFLIARTGLYTYPDVVVVCGERQLQKDEVDTLLNPTVLFEVLSPTTEAYDRGKKSAHFRRPWSPCVSTCWSPRTRCMSSVTPARVTNGSSPS